MYELTHTTDRYGTATQPERFDDFRALSRRCFALGVVRFSEPGNLSCGAVYAGKQLAATFVEIREVQA